MALGYEGYVMLGGKYALGTGTSVPRARARLDSSGGYGGTIKTPVDEIGIGAPRDYGWDKHEGTLNFDLTKDFWLDPLYAWIFDRQTAKEVFFVSRDANEQRYSLAFWNSISISASEGGVVDGSVGFAAIERTTYAYGTTGVQGFVDNVTGQGLMCPFSSFPKPLNAVQNLSPIPFWNTKVEIDGVVYDFVTWTLSFAQDVVLFFACMDTGSGSDPEAEEPEYLAAGPMTVTFSGDYMLKGPAPDGGTDAQIDGKLTLGAVGISPAEFKMNKMELQSGSDDVTTGDSLVPLSVEYAVYDIEQT